MRRGESNGASGFTLIELVIVITIIGILAAVALPRYTAIQHDARVAKAQALFGAMRSAAALAHARCLLDLAQGSGTCTAAAGTAAMEGAAVAMVNGYPARGGITGGGCAAGNRGYTGIFQAAQVNDCSDGVLLSDGANPTTIQIVGATTAANCQISYTEALANASPVMLVDTTGC